MIIVLKIIKWILLLVGLLSVLLMVYLQMNYGLVSKFIAAPSFHEKALSVYMNMAGRLLETGDITMASIRRVKIADDVKLSEVEEAMASIATERGIREVGILPLSEQVEEQTGKKQRYLKIFQYCSPRVAMEMVDYSDAFGAYLPCRIALIEDKKGKYWLYTLDMDLMIYGGSPLPLYLQEKALQVRKTIYTIMDSGAQGDF